MLSLARKTNPQLGLDAMGKNKQSKNEDTLLEVRKAYLNVHINEYNQIKNEIVEFQNQRAAATNYSLLISAALITFIPQAIADFGDFVLLLAPIPFWGLIWYVITLDNFVYRNSSYIKWVLAPKMNRLLKEHAEKLSDMQQEVLEWEVYATFPNQSFLQSVIRGMAFGGRQVLLILPIIFFIAVFLYVTRIATFRYWSSGEKSLLIVNLVCVLWFVVMSLVIVRQYKAEYPHNE